MCLFKNGRKTPFLDFLLLVFEFLEGKQTLRLLGQLSKFLIFFYMGPYYVDFTFASDTTLIRLDMTEIWPKYVAQAFLPPSE